MSTKERGRLKPGDFEWPARSRFLKRLGRRGSVNYKQTIDRLVNRTTFHVTTEILTDSERRFRDRQRELNP